MVSYLFSLLLAATQPVSVTAPCTPVAGADRLFDQYDLRWLIVGEIHGTAEIPASFGDLVCAAAKQNRMITVGVEYPTEDQSYIDAFLASDGGLGAREKLLARPFWRFNDGRSSEAAFLLLERLRKMKREGMIASVFAFQPRVDRNLRSAEYEEEMSKIVRRASKGRTLAIILVGNIHAGLTVRTSSDGDSYMPMAGFLPRANTKTLFAAGNGGAAWNCVMERDSNTTPVCGAHSLGEPPKSYPRGIVLIEEATNPYNGYFNIGSSLTSSPPAIERAKNSVYPDEPLRRF